MRRLDPTSPTYLQDITRINPKTGFEFAKMQQEAGTARTEGQIKSTKLIADKLALLPEAYRMADTPEAYLALHRSVHADPVLGPYLQSVGATPEKGLATLQKAVDTGTFEDLRMNSMQSVSQILESMKPQVVAPSASVYSGGKFTQAPAAPEKAAAVPVSIAEYERSKTDPQFMRFLQDRAAAQRAPGTPATPAAPVQVIDPVTGKPVFVSREEALKGRMTPASVKPNELKQVPVHAQKAIVGASTAIKKIDDAIAALDSGAEEATGMKGYLPDMALNRLYPEGTEARAAVADIGSLVMHERSGAAVTASESPRLKPFIPLITDDKPTALKKLRRMRQIQADDAEALAGTYNPEQGFREFKVATPATPAAPDIDALLNKYK
jgi:hypothetical protein